MSPTSLKISGYSKHQKNFLRTDKFLLRKYYASATTLCHSNNPGIYIYIYIYTYFLKISVD